MSFIIMKLDIYTVSKTIKSVKLALVLEGLISSNFIQSHISQLKDMARLLNREMKL
jgi:hypothetical protein